jgi:hypothetical protein
MYILHANACEIELKHPAVFCAVDVDGGLPVLLLALRRKQKYGHVGTLPEERGPGL